MNPESQTAIDRSALSYWFPRLEAAGLPVPRTHILTMGPAAVQDLWQVFDGAPMGAAAKGFVREVEAAARSVGFPCFLRTDHTSGKHEWERTCYVALPGDIAAHVAAIAEYSECVDFFGLPWGTWAVRELLPTVPLGICPAYGNMPVCREFRFFVEDHMVRCCHPYWPAAALKKGGALIDADWAPLLDTPPPPYVWALASLTGRLLGGAWSVDILDTQRGWYITDLAEADRSWHWPDCPNATAED